MPYKEVFVCVGCGKEKGPVNHWFVAGILPSSSFKVLIERWNPIAAKAEHADSYCGQECLTKALSEWMHQADPDVSVQK